MPTLYTHYNFGLKVLNKVNKKLNKEINNNIKYYNIFNQGYDNLFYYLPKWNYYRNFAIRAHKNNVAEFFTNIINYLKEVNNPNLNPFLYGFINHYTLDTLMHPLINYLTKYHIAHAKVEYMYDNHLLDINNLKWHNSMYKTLIPKLKKDPDLIALIDEVFRYL